MAYATVDLTTGLLRMVQAGHPHPLLIRANGAMDFIGKGGMPVGLMPQAPFGVTELTMMPGDRLLLYTDGFTEAPVAGRAMLEPEGLLQLVGRCPPDQLGQEWLEDLFWNLTEVMDPDQTMDDDVSATLFEFNGN